MSDTEIDLDPTEQARRRAAEKLADDRDELEAYFFDFLEARRDQKRWKGTLAEQDAAAMRLANAAMKQALEELEYPFATVPLYFDVKAPQ